MSLYSWGANSHGQLGQGLTSEACCTPTKVNVCSFDPSSISSIVGGGGHTLLLHQSGNVYGAGWNHKGQIGIDGDCISTFHPIKSLQSYRISQLACGWDSSLAVTSDGTLLVWGSNSFCQLGFSKEKLASTKNPIVVSIARVKHASLGLRHIVLVTMEGRVLVCGRGNKSQLGLVDAKGYPLCEVDKLTLVPDLINVSRVACGQHHTIALTKNGQVYVWGDNKYGQLGYDPSSVPLLHCPQEVSLAHLKLRGHIISIFCGWTHSVLLTDKGEVINWGRNNYGQLGMENTSSWSPSVLKGLEGTHQFQIGSEHNIALNENGEILCWGWNEHGNCGVGSLNNVFIPEGVLLPEKRKAFLIGSGACHSFAVLCV